MWRNIRGWLVGAAALIGAFLAVFLLGKRAMRKDLDEANKQADLITQAQVDAVDDTLDAYEPDRMRTAGKAFVRKES